VNENFQELFKQLFGGGNAKLVLVDEENVLESGIEIIARPPGKKLQTVSLLSGGERTLTAVALLFSLFKVKPSAFCLTDELDAALDDSNIARYLGDAQGLPREDAVHHHHPQPADDRPADALYGVTMEKQGISKIVSVKFRQQIPEYAKAQAGHPIGRRQGRQAAGNVTGDEKKAGLKFYTLPLGKG
jgi:chromosome segregation protein